MGFDALDVSIELVEEMRKMFDVVVRVDRDLADQMRRAVNSISLNVGEGSRRIKGDRLHLWRIADGSVKELQTALRVAVAWRHVDSAAVAKALSLVDRELAMLWRMCRH